MWMTHIYIATDSSSPRVTEKRYGYVMECEASGEIRTREGFGRITGTYHQAILTALIESLQRFNQGCEVHIHTEDTFVLNMYQKNLKAWVSNGFITSKGKPVANREEWMKLAELTREHLVLAEPGKHTYTGWLLAEIEKRKEQENVI